MISLDRHRLPEAILEESRFLDVLVRAYVYCSSNFQSLKRSRGNPKLVRLYVSTRKEVAVILNSQRPSGHPLNIAAASLRPYLQASVNGEVVVRVAALLRALCQFAPYYMDAANRVRSAPPVQLPPEFGGGEFFVSIKPRARILKGLLAGGHKRLRDENAIAVKLSEYTDPVHFMPAAVNGIKLERKALGLETSRILESRLDSDNLKLAVSSLSERARLRAITLDSFPGEVTPRFVLDKISDEGAQRRILDGLFSRCHKLGISILVLPELRVSPALLSYIQSKLAAQSIDRLVQGEGLLLVVAGSWHEVTAGTWVNRCHVLDERGETVWTHDKLEAYRITERNIRNNAGLRSTLRVNQGGADEGIIVGDQLTVVDSPLGRMAVAICVGFFDRRCVSTTLRHSWMEFSEYRRLAFSVY